MILLVEWQFPQFLAFIWGGELLISGKWYSLFTMEASYWEGRQVVRRAVSDLWCQYGTHGQEAVAEAEKRSWALSCWAVEWLCPEWRETRMTL